MPTYIFKVSRAAQVAWDDAEFADGETLTIEVQRSAEVTGALAIVFSDTEGGDALAQKAFTGNAVSLRAADMALLAEGGTWFADIIELAGPDQYRVRKGRVVNLRSIRLMTVPDDWLISGSIILSSPIPPIIPSVSGDTITG